jgi:hypothetical protein
MADFLPENYDVPSASDKYYKFKPGDNRFRIMSSPLMGTLGWCNKKPVRKPMNVTIDTNEVDDPSENKHFWAMVVYDYESKKAKVLEITQKGIMKSLKALANDKDWGSPVGTNGYDIVVAKSGDGMETEYNVTPKPKKKLEDGIEKYVTDMGINLEALLTGADPFEPKPMDLDSIVLDEN